MLGFMSFDIVTQLCLTIFWTKSGNFCIVFSNSFGVVAGPYHVLHKCNNILMCAVVFSFYNLGFFDLFFCSSVQLLSYNFKILHICLVDSSTKVCPDPTSTRSSLIPYEICNLPSCRSLIKLWEILIASIS